jgi:hypothetical protein
MIAGKALRDLRGPNWGKDRMALAVAIPFDPAHPKARIAG